MTATGLRKATLAVASHTAVKTSIRLLEKIPTGDSLANYL